MFRRLNSFGKDILLYSKVFYLLYPFRKFFLFLYNFSNLTVWVSKNKSRVEYSDFFRVSRNYDDRINGYQKIVEKFSLQKNNSIIYMEFGVASGVSFRWWLSNSTNQDSKFYGFDTFEGLPENWGFFYKKGDMSHEIEKLDDTRYQFIKGLFQETFPGFISENILDLKSDKRKIIHLDADLFSATLFVLSQIYPYLHAGDVIIFDEFSVPSHEFFAFDIFQKSFYVKLKPIISINNFYQNTFVVE